jgi:mRNA interferase HigB
VNVIALRTLRTFWEQHPDSEFALRGWYRALVHASPQNFSELKDIFGSVDLTHLKAGETVTIFDIAGNHYRVITRIDYTYQAAFILCVFTHKQYDRWNRGNP